MKILITGGEGFIGQHLCRRLAKDGHEVISLDSRDPAPASVEARPVLHHFPVQQIKPGMYIDVERIFHLACPASPKTYMADPIGTLDTAFNGTKAVLDLARETSARVLIASSSEVYGNPSVHPQPEWYYGNVNTFGPRACYSDDTEILTGRGWVDFPSLLPTDQVATIDEKHNVHYIVPRDLIRQPYTGEMYHFSNMKMDILVTPDHRMLDEREGRPRSFTEAASAIEWRHRTTPSGGVWPDQSTPDRWLLPPAPPNAKVVFESVALDDWMEFVGLYLAEGCVTSSTRKRVIDGHEYEVREWRTLLAHDHGWKYERIKACLAKLPWAFHELDHQFTISNKQLAEALAPLGHRSVEKQVPREYLDLPPRTLRILFSGMMLDGSHRDGRAYYTSSPYLAAGMQEIALKIGKAATIAEVDPSGNPWSDRISYRVNLRPAVNAHYPEPNRIPYNGYVYCVDAPPFHTILVRRNGKAIFNGNCYDEGKRAAEALAWAYFTKHKVNTRIARIFNTYGPGMGEGDGRVVSTFISQALRGVPLTVHGGKQTRSLCYIDDMVEGLIRLMSEDSYCAPVNLGNPEEVTIRDLAEEILDLIGSASPIFYDETPIDDPARRCPDIGRAKTLLDWVPKITRAEGLKRTIAWWKGRS